MNMLNVSGPLYLKCKIFTFNLVLKHFYTLSENIPWVMGNLNLVNKLADAINCCTFGEV